MIKAILAVTALTTLGLNVMLSVYLLKDNQRKFYKKAPEEKSVSFDLVPRIEMKELGGTTALETEILDINMDNREDE